jgi:hypothetical protein
MRFWWTLGSLLRTILYGWMVALWRLVRLLCSRRPRPKQAPSGCVRIDHPALVRPDPLLYSQRYLMAQGLAVTWDNPDITLFRGGVPVSSADLEPATTYEVRARIWNNSLEAPVVHMPVRLSYLDFGIGTEPIPVTSTAVDVGVKGSANQPAVASMLWTTPATPGHYCLQVLLDPADDLNSSNNLGQENTDVVIAHSPATFSFTLRNTTRQQRRYHFETDAYTIPPLPGCDQQTDTTPPIERHRRDRHPVPDGFAVQVNPPTPTLESGATVTVTVTVEPPPGFLGRQAINVNAFHQQGFAGGVTLTAMKEP